MTLLDTYSEGDTIHIVGYPQKEGCTIDQRAVTGEVVGFDGTHTTMFFKDYMGFIRFYWSRDPARRMMVSPTRKGLEEMWEYEVQKVLDRLESNYNAAVTVCKRQLKGESA